MNEAISNKSEIFRQFFELPKGHPHGKDTRTNAAVVRYLIAEPLFLQR